jgi:hypothetical protein
MTTSTLSEVLKQMVEALEVDAYVYNGEKSWAAIKAGKQAIAELESQEPYGWVKIDEVREHFGSIGCGTIYKTAGEDRVSLYTHPPQRTWVGLTEDEIAECFKVTPDLYLTWHIYKRIEAKLKEKNS